MTAVYHSLLDVSNVRSRLEYPPQLKEAKALKNVSILANITLDFHA